MVNKTRGFLFSLLLLTKKGTLWVILPPFLFVSPNPSFVFTYLFLHVWKTWHRENQVYHKSSNVNQASPGHSLRLSTSVWLTRWWPLMIMWSLNEILEISVDTARGSRRMDWSRLSNKTISGAFYDMKCASVAICYFLLCLAPWRIAYYYVDVSTYTNQPQYQNHLFRSKWCCQNSSDLLRYEHESSVLVLWCLTQWCWQRIL